MPTGAEGGDRGGGLTATPLSTIGLVTLPSFPFVTNVSVSASTVVALPTRKWNLTVSPPPSAYSVI